MADCWYLKGPGQNTNGTRPSMLVTNSQPPQVTMSQPPVKLSASRRPTEEYAAFISEVTVCASLADAKTPVVVWSQSIFASYTDP